MLLRNNRGSAPARSGISSNLYVAKTPSISSFRAISSKVPEIFASSEMQYSRIESSGISFGIQSFPVSEVAPMPSSSRGLVMGIR
jgi:hypothetical protein